MSFALGRGIDYTDMPAVRAIVRNAQRENYRFSALLLGVIESPQFLQHNVAAPEGPVPGNVLALRSP